MSFHRIHFNFYENNEILGSDKCPSYTRAYTQTRRKKIPPEKKINTTERFISCRLLLQIFFVLFQNKTKRKKKFLLGVPQRHNCSFRFPLLFVFHANQLGDPMTDICSARARLTARQQASIPYAHKRTMIEEEQRKQLPMGKIIFSDKLIICILLLRQMFFIRLDPLTAHIDPVFESHTENGPGDL